MTAVAVPSIAAEYDYLDRLYGPRGLGWNLFRQSLVRDGNRWLDVLEIDRNGRRETHRFDISSFFGLSLADVGKGGGGGGGGHGGGGGGHGGGGHGGGGFHSHPGGGFRRPFFGRGFGFGPGWGGWWGGPWWGWLYPQTQTQTCTRWSSPVQLTPDLVVIAGQLLSASGGAPASGYHQGILYLFSTEGGGLTARPCAATATS
jgi:hypothetical protein